MRKPVMSQLGLGIILVIWLLLDTLLIGENQLSSSMFYSYMISAFIFILGSCSSEYVDRRVLKNINNIYVGSMLLVTADIFVTYFGIGYNLATKVYAYSAKNSVSQIIFTAIILLIVRFKPQKMSRWIIKFGAIAFELYVLLLLRSRATLVGLILCLLVLVFAKDVNKKFRITISIVGITVIVLLLTNSQFNNFIINNVLFAGRNVSDLNELTSGRVDIISSYPQIISENWVTGIGPTYYECFPLSAILQFGLIGGILCIGLSLQPLWKSFVLKHESDDWFLLYIIAIGYSVNGLFEGLAPFGPGVKCYYMWLLFGIMLSKPFFGIKRKNSIIN